MSSHSKNTAQQKKRIDRLFLKFAAFYGHVWRSQFKSESFLDFAKKEWGEALSTFDNETLEKAILYCRENCEMPPTLPQLIQCCKAIIKRNTFFMAKENPSKASQSVVLSHIGQCKQYLNETRKGEQHANFDT